VKAEIVLGDTEGFDFYGTVETSYTVTQEAGKKVSTWVPEACTAKLAGTYRSMSGEKASTASITAVVGAFKGTVSTSAPAGTVSVLGGTLPSGSELAGWIVGNFYLGKTEVTWDQWKEVRDWAVKNGYTDLANVGASTGGNYPVTNVNWYDVVKWCNAKSEKEGRMPVYQVNGRTYKIGKSEPVVKTGAKGYRLPTEAEWEWAARGGRQTHGHAYSGSDDLNAVGWYDGNAGGGMHQVGKKSANELGISDMSGNVWEWCGDWYPGYGGSVRVLRGGYWYGLAMFCTVANRNDGNPGSRFSHCGFRVALNSYP
jgi:formylglycine-generating enzyme required for sulfatase activity